MTLHASGYIVESSLRAKYTTEAQARARLEHERINREFSAMARAKKTPEGQKMVEGFERFRRENEERELEAITQRLLAGYAP
jgi:hypothetical protein